MSWSVDIGVTTCGWVERITEELNNHVEAIIQVESTSARRTLVGTDQDVTVEYASKTIWFGRLTDPDYEEGIIKCKCFDKVAVTLAQCEPYSADYTASGVGATAANTILTNILSGTGVSVGVCPTTAIEVRFNRTNRFYAALYLATALGLDWWTTGGNTFNIGVKGGVQYEFKLNENTGSVIYDSTANKEQGSLAGGYSWVAGKFGYGVLTASATSGRINTGVQPGICGASDAWSFVLIIKANAGETGTIFGIQNGTAGIRIEWSSDKIRVRAGDGTNSVDFTGTTDVADGTFHVVGLLYDPSNDDVILYVDGDVDGSDLSTVLGATDLGTVELRYGCHNNGGTNSSYTDATFDELLFFKEGLSPRQFDALGGLDLVDAAALAEALLDRRLHHGTSRGKQKNYCVIVGVDSAGNEVTGAAYVDQTTGRVVEGEPSGWTVTDYKPIRLTEKKSATQADLQRQAAGVLRDYLTDTRNLQVPLSISDGYDLFDGDFVLAENDDLVLADVYRIYMKETTISSVVLSLDVLAPDSARKILALNQLEELGIYPGPAADLPKGSQQWNTNVVFTAVDNDTVSWDDGASGNPVIKFADGDQDTITAGNSGDLAAGEHFIYYTWNDATLNICTRANYQSAVTPDSVVLAKVTVSTDPDQEIGIETFGSFGTQMMIDMISPNAVDGAILKIENRKWTTDLSFVWDEANKDWDDIDWGQAGNELTTDASIKFTDGVTETIEHQGSDPHPDGVYYYYWDVNFKVGGKFQLQRSTNHANAMGAGKGLIGMVAVDNANSKAPTMIPVDAYTPIIGAGILSSWAVETIHLTSKSIHGKDIATGQDVGESGGNPGVRIIGTGADIIGTAIGDSIGGNFAAGIYAFASGPKRTIYIDPATGIIWFYGVGMVGWKTYPGVPPGEPGNVTVGYVDATAFDLGLGSGSQRALMLKTNTTNQLVGLDSGGNALWLDQQTGYVVIDDAWTAVIPQTTGNVDLGTSSLKYGDIWGTGHYADLYMEDMYCPKCGVKFKQDDSVCLTVKKVHLHVPKDGSTPFEEIVCVPIHARCSIIALIRRWLSRHLSGLKM